MADISKLKVPGSNATYNIKDASIHDGIIELNLAKNALHFDAIGTSSSSGTSVTINGVTFTINADYSVTAERTSSSSSTAICNFRFNNDTVYLQKFFTGDYIFSGCPSGGSTSSYQMTIANSGTVVARDTGDGVELPNGTGVTGNVWGSMRISSSFTGSKTFKPMICLKSAWNISHEYKPYKLPTYQELYNRAGKLGHAVVTVNFNDVSWSKLSTGVFYTTTTVDASDKFDVIYSATLYDFGNLASNISVAPYIRPDNARFGLWVVDTTNPQTLPMTSGTNVKVSLFGILKNPI